MGGHGQQLREAAAASECPAGARAWPPVPGSVGPDTGWGRRAATIDTHTGLQAMASPLGEENLDDVPIDDFKGTTLRLEPASGQPSRSVSPSGDAAPR